MTIFFGRYMLLGVSILRQTLKHREQRHKAAKKSSYNTFLANKEFNPTSTYTPFNFFASTPFKTTTLTHDNMKL